MTKWHNGAIRLMTPAVVYPSIEVTVPTDCYDTAISPRTKCQTINSLSNLSTFHYWRPALTFTIVHHPQLLFIATMHAHTSAKGYNVVVHDCGVFLLNPRVGDVQPSTIPRHSLTRIANEGGGNWPHGVWKFLEAPW